MSLNPTMTKAAREAFFAEPHVAVFAVADAGRGPCAVPIWYHYAPGDVVRMTIPESTLKMRLLRAAGRASLCAQQEALPSKYVSVEGPIEVLDGDVERWQREIALRYLGPKLAPRYLATNAGGLSDERLVVLRPERWWSVDFSNTKI